MPEAHREGDLRACEATTVVVGQSTVFVNGKKWAVEDDPNTHGGGGLIPSHKGVYIEGKPVIVITPDKAKIDGLDHVENEDETASASPDVTAYGS